MGGRWSALGTWLRSFPSSPPPLFLFIFLQCLLLCFFPSFLFPFLLFHLLLLFHLTFLFLCYLLSLFSSTAPLSSPSRTPHQLLRILAPRGSRLRVVVWGRALKAWYSRSSGNRVPRVQNASAEDSCTHHPCLFQPQVQQLLHGVGRRLHKLWAAGPDQPHGPRHWLPGGLGHWPNDLYGQW